MSNWFVVMGRAWPVVMEAKVDRHTDASVWIGGKRRARSTEWERYFQTWAEAHAFLLADAEEKIQAARQRLRDAQGRYGNIKGMKPPAISNHPGEREKDR